MGTNDNEIIEIDVKELCFVLFNKIHILILALILGGVTLYFISTAFVTPKYQSTTAIYVLNKQDNNVVTYSDLQTGTQLTKDYAELVTSRSVMEKVISQLNLEENFEDMENIDSEKLADMVSVDNTTDTRIIKITVTDTNPGRAQDIANAIREAAALHITEVMDIEAVNVVDYAEMPMKPVSPKLMLNTVIGALAGLILAVLIIIVLYMLDDTIKGPDDIERYLGISLLGTIPLDESLNHKKKSKKKRKYEQKQRGVK
jgi:capsular polysaccharide biosynthesis protein